MKSKKLLVFIGFLVTVVVATGIYAIGVPAIASRQYSGRVRTSVQSLRMSLLALDKSTSLPLMTDSSAPAEMKEKNAAYISDLITTTRQKLAVVKNENDSLTPMPYANIFNQFNEADVLHDHAERFIGQTESAVDEYAALTTYLRVYNNTIDDVTSELNTFNKATDLNGYAGQSDAIREIATIIRADADRLSKTPQSRDVESLNSSTIAIFNEAASGFDDLAGGLAIPADDPIYGAARKIESATTELDYIVATSYESTVRQSRAIKNIHDFTEKLDLVLDT